MKTFQTNASNDFVVAEDGNLAIIQDIDAAAQESRHYAATLLGEMIHAKDEGIPYFQHAFSRTPSLAQMEAALRRRIMSMPDVVKITSLTASIQGETLSYTATIQTTYGTVTVNDSI